VNNFVLVLKNVSKLQKNVRLKMWLKTETESLMENLCELLFQ
jgi:hypothetical protein